MPALSISERIQQTTDALGAIDGLTERKFLAIGNSIEQAVVVLARLAATFEALVAAMQSDAVIKAQQNLALASAEAATRADAPSNQAAALDRVSAPVGLDVGSESVAEIAVSIVAELIARRNRGPAALASLRAALERPLA